MKRGLVRLALIPAMTAMTGCGQSTQDTETDLPPPSVLEDSLHEVHASRFFDLETRVKGFFINDGRALPHKTTYNVWGVNGFNAIVLYSESGPKAAGYVTHYEAGIDGVIANCAKWMGFAASPDLLGATRHYFTIFHVNPVNAEWEADILQELYFLTASLKSVFGERARIRYQGYPMEPPGSKLGTTSLQINLDEHAMTTEWHGDLDMRFDHDEAFAYRVRYLSPYEHEAIRDRVIALYQTDAPAVETR